MYKFARIVFFIYFHVFNRIRIKGLENIVENGPTIVFGNHYSDFDIFLLTVAFKRQIHFMAKKSLFSIPVVKWFVKAYKAFPVDREKNDLNAIKTALRYLRDGKQIGIFPEGRRVREQSDSVAKGGIAMLAFKSKATLVPVRMKYKRKVHFLNSYEVIIDKPVKWDALGIEKGSAEEYRLAGEKLMEKIYEL